MPDSRPLDAPVARPWLWREAMKGQEGGDTTGNNVTGAERVTGSR
jgi:hypothetical protein